MADFDFAYAFMAPHEWNQAHNYTNDPDDPGGATKFGVIQRTLDAFNAQHPGLGLPASVAGLEEQHAKVIYRMKFWVWDALSDDILAAKCFDIGVNLGPATAILFLQDALCDVGYAVECDRLLGHATVGAANAADPDEVITHLCERQRTHYQAWVGANLNRGKFLAGLLARAAAIPAKE